MTIESRTRSRAPVIGAVVGAVAVVAALAWLARPLWPVLTDPEQAREVIEAAGPWGPVVFVAVQVVQVVVAPLPGQVAGLVGGYLFGPVWGVVYSAVGTALGVFLVLLLARRLGRPFVERFVDERTVARFDGLVASRGPFVLFLIYLLPGFPDDLITFLAGLTRIRIPVIVAISVAGRLPGLVALALAGDGLTHDDLTLAVTAGVVLLALTALALWKREWIRAFVTHERRLDFVKETWPASPGVTILWALGVVVAGVLLVELVPGQL